MIWYTDEALRDLNRTIGWDEYYEKVAQPGGSYIYRPDYKDPWEDTRTKPDTVR